MALSPITITLLVGAIALDGWFSSLLWLSALLIEVRTATKRYFDV
jgi:hypothetical protein